MDSITGKKPLWRFKPVAIRFLAAQVVAFLYFAPYASRYTVDANRYSYDWGLADAASLIAAVLLLGLAFQLGYELVRRIGRAVLTRAAGHLFVFALGAGLLNNVAFYCTSERGYETGQFGPMVGSAWLALIAVAAYSFAKPASRLVYRSRQFCQMLSPVLLICVVQFLRPPYYPMQIDPLPTAKAVVPATQPNQSRGPVYLFVFDMWSYQRTFENGHIRPGFANLEALSQQSLVFDEVHSPGDVTMKSLPGLLYQTDREPLAEEGTAGFESDGNRVPTEQLETVFAEPRSLGYQTIMLGFSLPYGTWLKNKVDVVRSYSFYSHENNLAGQCSLHALRAMKYSTDPWLNLFYRTVYSHVDMGFAERLHGYMRKDIESIITQCPTNTFAVMHYPLPHGPFIFDRNGKVRPPKDDSCEDYLDHLGFLDRTIGEFALLMKQAGRFEDATVILTSDHTWQGDPLLGGKDRDAALTHVPLIVKLPYQQEHISVADRFETHRLGALISEAMKQADPAQAPQRIAAWAKSTAATRPH